MTDSSTPPTPPPDESPPPLGRLLKLPRLSGKATAVCLVGFFLATALLIPGVVRLPLWIDFQIVLGIWWATWLVVLTVLLYRGQRVSDDHQLGQPRNWLDALKGKPANQPKKAPHDGRKKERGSSWLD